ncbi:MAG: hypothetical protein ABSF91_08235 [Bacteroidota bacterium]|jgi:hypothetical protein
MEKNSLIKVQVHYIAAGKPFQKDAQPSETVGELKTQALVAFGLSEGGGKTFKLFHQKQELLNMSQTLGEIADGKKELKLDLEEVLIQG